MAEVDGMLSALSWPQRQLKEAVSGDEQEWFSPDGMNPHLYAAGNVAMDLVADPLNLIPVGLLSRAAKATKAALAPGSGKGMAIAGAPNYIKNFYGLTDGSATQLTPVEAVGTQAIQKATGRPYNEALGGIRKVKGMAEWAGQSAKGAAHTLSPTSRALYKEKGIHPATQEIVGDYMKAGGRKDIDKAAANVNYLNHIQKQAGRTGPLDESVAEVAHRSNLESYTPNKEGQISEWMTKNAGTEADGKAVELGEKTAKYIEDHVNGSWGPSETVVMKRARSGTGGNHFNDMYRGKLAPVGPLREAFMKAGKDPDINAVYRHLKKNEGKGANYWKVKTKNADDLAENGLWLTGSGPGSAITEGGVNWLMKVEPDGTLMSVISDKHDFLEKLPVAGRVAKEHLPNDLVAVTPPMFANIKKIRKSQFDKAGHAAPERAVSGVQRKKAPKEATTLTLLEDFVSAKPSQQAVKAEQLKQAGMLSTVPAAINTGDNE
jgi:hypothetical protein